VLTPKRKLSTIIIAHKTFWRFTPPVVCVLTNHILWRLLVNSPSSITQKPQVIKQPLMANNTNKGGGWFVVLGEPKK
jgi:hypothetical protein